MRLFDIDLWLWLGGGSAAGTGLIHAADAHSAAGGLINFD
jgi:hypothetical protein